MPEIKRVTLHPLNEDGTIDRKINIYPKTLVDGVVDREGNEVDIATQKELNDVADSFDSDLKDEINRATEAEARETNRAIEAETTLDETKQDNIPDLEDIRSKANTAVQPEDLATVATTGSYHDLLDKPIIPEIPVADVLVNGQSVVDEEKVADIKLKTINGEPVNGEGNIEVVTDLSDYYTKEESDEITDDLEERIENVEDQVLVYNYFYSVNSQEILPDDSDSDSEDEVITHSSIIFPILKTKYNLLEFSAKNLSDTITDCSVDLLEPEVLWTGDKILDNTTPITLYQTGLKADMTTSKYGYDTFDILNKKVYRYCYPITFRELFSLFDSTDFTWNSGTANGRLTIRHDKLATKNIYTENGFIIKTNRDIGLVYKGLSNVNFTIDNLLSIPGVTDKASIISVLSGDDYADVKLIFKRVEPVVEDRSDIVIEIPSISCSGQFETGISGFGGCVKASYLNINELMYTKDQCDAKFQTISEYVSQYAANEHIVKIGDPNDNNNIPATSDIYTTLKDFGWPKVATAHCVIPAEGEEYTGTLLPQFDGDALFINNHNETGYGYITVVGSNIYWFNVKAVSGEEVVTCNSIIPTVPVNVSAFENDAGYLTSVSWEDVEEKPEFATVATSGSYNDLSDKPYIPEDAPNNSNILNDEADGSLYQVKPFNEGLTWTSADENIATVDENGHVEAVSVGTTTITVKDTLGRTAECEVNVSAPVGRSLRKGALRSTSAITWEKVTGTITAGEYLIAYAKDDTNYYMQPTNTESSGDITTAAGKYLANTFPISSDINLGFVFTDAENSKFYIKDGSCYVRANGTTNNGLASAKDNNTNPDYGIWTITETASGSGEYTIINNNDRQISLYLSSTTNNWRSYGNTSGSKTNVYLYRKVIPVTGITITNPGTLIVGSSYTLSATIDPSTASDKSITWSSSDSNIITINSSTGEATAIAEGTATITAVANGGTDVSDSITVSVEAAAVVTDITVTANPSSGVYGDTLDITATVEGSGSGYNVVNWTNSNPNIATLIPTGANTATATLTRNIGTTTITATSAVEGYESISGSCTITNNQIYVDSITIDPETPTDLTVGLVYQTGCTVEPDNATNPNVIWSTSDPTVATISNEEISAIGVGTAIIKATAADGGHPIPAEDSITVTVSAPLGQLYLNKTTLNLKVGESYDLVCSEYPFNKAEGVLSTALGSGSVATEDNQVVVGTYNEETDSLFIVGNGESEATRANAFEVTPEGKAIVGANTENSDSANTLVTKGFAEAAFLAKTRTVNILTSDWVDSAVELDLSPVSVGSADVLFVSPTDDCAQEYYNCGIQRAANGSILTLTAATLPENTITIQIIYFKGQAF